GRDAAVSGFIALRTRPGAELLPRLLKSPHLTTEQRSALIRSFGNYLLDPPIKLDALVAFLADQPGLSANEKKAALEVFALPGLPRPVNLGHLLLTWLEDPAAEIRIGALKAIEESHLANAAPKALQIASDTARRSDERAAAIRVLRV